MLSQISQLSSLCKAAKKSATFDNSNSSSAKANVDNPHSHPTPDPINKPRLSNVPSPPPNLTEHPPSLNAWAVPTPGTAQGQNRGVQDCEMSDDKQSAYQDTLHNKNQ